MLTSCLGIVCTAILVGIMMNFGLLWVIYIKVACGLRRSPCYQPSIITTPRNLPTVQPTCVQQTRPITTITVVLPTPVSLPLPTQVITSTCPPWVTTTLVSCTPLATPASIGRQVLTQGSTPTRTTWTSPDMASAWATSAASPGTGSAGSSSPCDCPLQVSPSKRRGLMRKNMTKGGKNRLFVSG